MPKTAAQATLPLPKQWTGSVQSALLQIVALAKYALVNTRSWASDSTSQRVRLAVKADELQQEIALLREEIRLKDLRMDNIPAAQRPHYRPTERLAILELRAARGWSLAQTSPVFQVTSATITSWSKRLDEEGTDALLRIPEPVNKFPQFVTYVVQRLQTLCPRLGKVKVAQTLARAGLHLGVSTVGRMRGQKPAPPPAPDSTEPAEKPKPTPSAKRVTAKRPNHIWHVDLTTVPTAAGFWAPWLPFAVLQCWPFCWWIALVMDSYSRRIQGFTLFKQQPTSEQVRRFLGRVIGSVGTAPKYLITDSGVQFTCAAFRPWCQRHGVRQRKGAVGKTGSIALIERMIKTLKYECTRLLPVVSLVRRAFQRDLSLFIGWYNENRPHMSLAGVTPNEIYSARRPPCRAPRFETRAAWPRGSPCARPRTLVKGQPGAKLDLEVTFVVNRRHLPLVKLTRAA